MNKNEYLLKLLLIGEQHVGKTAIIKRLLANTFDEAYSCTVAVDFKIKSIELDKKHVRLNMWDASGCERNRTIAPSYYGMVDAIIIVYDVTKKSTFNRIPYWLEQIQKYAKKNVDVILMGTKADCSDDKRQVPFFALKNLAEIRLQLQYYEVNSKTNDTNVLNVFMEISKKLEHKFELNKRILKKENKMRHSIQFK